MNGNITYRSNHKQSLSNYQCSNDLRSVPHQGHSCLASSVIGNNNHVSMGSRSGVRWCIVVKGELYVAGEAETVRLSISIPAEDYADIKQTAETKRVSIAWVVRDAVRQYLKDQAPLFRS